MIQYKALKIALEVLEDFVDDPRCQNEIDKAIIAIKEALAQQCVCGEPDSAGTHRTDGPCLAPQPELCKYGQEPKSCTSSPMDCQCALDATFAQPEQEEKLPPVEIGVDVTKESTTVTAFYRKPNSVMEIFYSQFHPLAQPEQEPVAWMYPDALCDRSCLYVCTKAFTQFPECATTPPQRTWVGLTDEDMTECIVVTCNTDDGTADTRDLIRAVEAKLKEKNMNNFLNKGNDNA